MDLSIGKLPTLTTQMSSKRPKYSEEFIYPNSQGPSRVIFNGPSGSGKTNFALSLLTDARHMAGFFDMIYVFCPSAGMQADYDHLVQRYSPHELQIIDFSPATLEAAIADTRQMSELCKSYDAPMPQTLFLFDDLINTPGFDKHVSTLSTKARQWCISVWVISQSLMSLSRLMRIQASNIFCFSPTQSEIERMAAECTNAIANEDMVERMVRAATVQRYEPVHVYRQAPVHLQYRKGLTTFFVLHDPANIHGDEAST